MIGKTDAGETTTEGAGCSGTTAFGFAGNAVVEAQYSLRPVVATAALGHTESIVDGVTGLLVPAEDVPAMADAIARLIDDPYLAETLSRTARSEAIRLFSVDRYGAEIVELFDRLTGATSVSTPTGRTA